MAFSFGKPALRLTSSPETLTYGKSYKTTISTEDEEKKLMKEMLYELLKDEQKKQLGKNNEAKMTLYNRLPCKEYERVFMCKTAKEVWHTLIITHQGNSQVKNCKIDLLTQEYDKFLISHEENIDSGFIRFNVVVTSLKSLDPDYSSKNYVRKFLHALPLKWRAKVMAIEEAKDLTTLPLNELIRNLKVYEMVLDNDGVGSKTTKVTRDQTSDDCDSQEESDEDIDEEESEAFNLFAKNFHLGKKVVKAQSQRGLATIAKGHFASECRKPKENKAFIGRAWSDSEDGDEHQNDATYLMAIDSQEVVSKLSSSNIDLNIIDLQKKNKELLKFNKDFTKTSMMVDMLYLGATKGKVVGGGNITHDSIIITNVEHVSVLAFNLINVGYSQPSKAYIVLNTEAMRIEESLNVTFDESLPEPKSSSSVEDDRTDEPIVQDLNGSPSLQVNVSDEGYPKNLKEARGHPIEQVIDNQVGSPNSVLDNEIFEISSNESDFDVNAHPNDEEVNSDNVVIPQSPNKEVITRIYNTRIPPYLIREVRIGDKIGNPLSPNHIEHGYLIYCENTINTINSFKDLSEENMNMLSSINEAIKLMLTITTNISYVIENIIEKQDSKDNLKEYDTLKICDIGTKNTLEGNALDPWIPALKQGGSTI
ncbi:hypothetical protein Tco_1439715 [Tanacetum coccineum]